MVKIENDGQKITMIRGDTIDTVVSIWTSSGKPYIPEEGDIIRFALKASYLDSTPLILKVIPHNTMELRIESEETKLLKPQTKPYVYDVEITFVDGTVDTFLSGKMYVEPEVY